MAGDSWPAGRSSAMTGISSAVPNADLAGADLAGGALFAAAALPLMARSTGLPLAIALPSDLSALFALAIFFHALVVLPDGCKTTWLFRRGILPAAAPFACDYMNLM